MGPELGVDILDAREAIGHDRSVRQAAHLVRRRRVLVADAAEQARDQIFEGHDACGATELVEHDRHWLAGSLHSGQYLDHRGTLRDDDRRTDQSPQTTVSEW